MHGSLGLRQISRRKMPVMESLAAVIGALIGEALKGFAWGAGWFLGVAAVYHWMLH